MGHDLKMALQVVQLSRASYYRRLTSLDKPDRRQRELDKELVKELIELSGYETTYGYRKVTVKLEQYNHKKVYRHMKRMNMLQPRKLKKFHKHRLPITCPIESDSRWEADLTYVFDGRQTNYLFNIIDVYDKEPIGDYYGLRCRADEAIHSLEEAVKTRFGSLELVKEYRVTMRVDQGSQYISKKFKKRAKELGVKLEYCGIKCPDDKPYIESFFSRYKCEEVYRNEYQSYRDAFLGWIQYKHWYKTERIHQGLNWMTIPEFKNKKGSHLAAKVLSQNIGA